MGTFVSGAYTEIRVFERSDLFSDYSDAQFVRQAFAGLVRLVKRLRGRKPDQAKQFSS